MIATRADGSRDLVGAKPGAPGSTNVTLRAVTPLAFKVREGMKIVEGRNFTPGLDEVIVGHKIMGRIQGVKLGERVST